MLRRFPSIALAVVATSMTQFVLLSGASEPKRKPPATDSLARTDRKESPCCNQECKAILLAFERASEDDLSYLVDISSRAPCDHPCRLAKSLVATKTNADWWAARFPVLLPGAEAPGMERCSDLLKGKHIAGGLVVFDVSVDEEGNPLMVSRLRGLSNEDFNSCVHAFLLGSCYRPAFREGRFVPGRATISFNVCVK